MLRSLILALTFLAATGAGAGVLAGLLAVVLLPGAGSEAGVLTGLRFQGGHWLLPLLVPLLAAVVAFAATRYAAMRVLGGLR